MFPKILEFFEHCSVFVKLRPRNTAMLKKFQNFREHGPGLDIDARISDFLEFFEHYRVS